MYLEAKTTQTFFCLLKYYQMLKNTFDIIIYTLSGYKFIERKNIFEKNFNLYKLKKIRRK